MAHGQSVERRGRDSNPRWACTQAGFQDRCNLDGTGNQGKGLHTTADSGCTNGCTPEPESSSGCTPVSPELALVINAWPLLPQHLKAAVLALVATAEAATH